MSRYNNELKIGDHYKDGIIVYLNKDGQSGLMITSEDMQTNEVDWYEACGNVKWCDEGGFSDWRLPTKAELLQIGENIELFDNFYYFDYWSFTEHYKNFAWVLHASTGQVYPKHKDNENHGRIRPIRNF